MTPTQRATMEQALEALIAVNGHVCQAAHHAKRDQHSSGATCPVETRHDAAVEALRAALAEQPAEQEPFKPDWDRVEALRESLREHMADVRQLRAALAWIASHKNSDWSERCQQIVDKARAALAEQPAEQEPVAWIDGSDLSLMMRYGRGCIAWGTEQNNAKTPLYTEPQPAIPPGYKLVPVEPTEEMCNPTGEKGPVAGMSAGYRKEIWKSMLAAAPEAPQPAKRVQLTDDEIDVLWAKQQTKPFKTHAEDRMAFARAVIAAYDAKNGITGETK